MRVKSNQTFKKNNEHTPHTHKKKKKKKKNNHNNNNTL